MIRRLNFTGRRKLSRADVTIRLAAGADGRPVVHASFDLASHGLPPASRLFVEAYRQTSWQRFDFGTVAVPGPREAAVLRAFATAQGVKFRVRVVEAEPTGRAPRILAHADDLRPASPAKGRGGLSLLPVDWGELTTHTWKLEVDEESGPLLLVSRTLVPDRESFVGSREFVSLVLPSLLATVLSRALLRAGEVEGDEAEGWAADWLRLARSLPGVGAPPERGRGSALGDDEEDWVEAAVDAFARNHGVAERFAAWWSVVP